MDPDPDSYPDADPGGPKTYGSCGSGSATLIEGLNLQYNADATADRKVKRFINQAARVFVNRISLWFLAENL